MLNFLNLLFLCVSTVDSSLSWKMGRKLSDYLSSSLALLDRLDLSLIFFKVELTLPDPRVTDTRQRLNILSLIGMNIATPLADKRFLPLKNLTYPIIYSVKEKRESLATTPLTGTTASGKPKKSQAQTNMEVRCMFPPLYKATVLDTGRMYGIWSGLMNWSKQDIKLPSLAKLAKIGLYTYTLDLNSAHVSIAVAMFTQHPQYSGLKRILAEKDYLGNLAKRLINHPALKPFGFTEKQLRKVLKVGVLSTMNGSGAYSSHVLKDVIERVGCSFSGDQIKQLWGIVFNLDVSQQFVNAVKDLGKNKTVYTAVSDLPVAPETTKGDKKKGGHTLAAKVYQTYEALIVSLVVESFAGDPTVCPISLEHDRLLLGTVDRINSEKERLIIKRAIDIVYNRIGLEIGIELEPAF